MCSPTPLSRPRGPALACANIPGYGKNRDLAVPFWSTKDPGQTPFSFVIGLGNVIKGWDEGVMGMKQGEIARIRVTPDYGYGAVSGHNEIPLGAAPLEDAALRLLACRAALHMLTCTALATHTRQVVDKLTGTGVGSRPRPRPRPPSARVQGGFPAWGIMPNSELEFEIEVLKV